MAEPLTEGFFPDNGSDHAPGVIRVCVYRPPVFAPFDHKLGMAPKLKPMKAIFVTRRVSIYSLNNACVYWEDGQEINRWGRASLPQWLKNRIANGIEETRRIAGGSRGRSKAWYRP